MSRQYYLADTNVLVTEMQCPTGVVEVTDAFTLRPGPGNTPVARGELLRYVRVLEGRAALHVSVDVGQQHLISDRPLNGPTTTLQVGAGDDVWFLLRWNKNSHPVHPRLLLDETAAAWRRWSEAIVYEGPQPERVRRSALLVKLLGHTETTGAARTAAALRQLGLIIDADHVLRCGLDDAAEPAEFLDCAFEWSRNGGSVDDALWHRLAASADAAVQPTHQPTTHAVAMRQVALDRAARLASQLHKPGHAGWSTQATALRERILREAWDETQYSLTARLGVRGGLDPCLLALPLRRVIPADHPRMVATANAIAKHLILEPSTTSFWLVENLLGQGRVHEAAQLYEDLCSRATPLGLFAGRLGTHAAAIAAGVALARATR